MGKIITNLIILIVLFFCLFPCVSNSQVVPLATGQAKNNDLNFEPIEEESINCESVFKKNGEYNSLYYALQDAFTFIKFLAPVLVIVLSSMDYIKAITSHDAEGLKKANSKFIKRLVIGVLIFLLPYILDFLFEAFGVYDIQTCGVGK